MKHRISSDMTMKIDCMTKIKKVREACFLACINSFLRDHGVEMRQECMISELVRLGLCSESGVVSRGNEDKACRVFNIYFSDVPYHYPIDKKYSDGSLLIGTTRPGLHCVRFWKQDEESKIIVMDPDKGDYVFWDKAFLEERAPQFHKVELQILQDTPNARMERTI